MNDYSKTVAALKRRGYEATARGGGLDARLSFEVRD